VVIQAHLLRHYGERNLYFSWLLISRFDDKFCLALFVTIIRWKIQEVLIYTSVAASKYYHLQNDSQTQAVRSPVFYQYSQLKPYLARNFE